MREELVDELPAVYQVPRGFGIIDGSEDVAYQ